MEIKTGKGELAASFVHTLLLFAGIYYPAGRWICELGEREALLFCLCSVVILIPAIAGYIAFRRTKTLVQFLLLGLAVAAVMGGIGYGTGTLFESIVTRHRAPAGRAQILCMVLAVFFTVVIFAVRGYVRIRKGKMIREFRELPNGAAATMNVEDWELPSLFDLPHPVHWVWFAVLYVLGMFLKEPCFWKLVFYLLLADIFLCFYCQFMDRMHGFIEEHQRIANLPVETMVRVGKIILSTAILILVLFVLPSALYGKDPLADAIAGYEPKEVEQQETEITVSATEGTSQMDLAESLAGLGEAKELPAWVQNIGKVIVFLMLSGMAVMLLKAIYQACKNAGSSFAAKDEDEILFLDKEETEERVRLGRKRKEGEGRFSPNMQIRRRYKKRIKKTLKSVLQGSETPTELEEKAEAERSEGMQTLHHYYEKARYSREGCTREEAEQTK